jgi:hypothetical protein
MMIAMVTMGMMQMAIHQIVHMIAVRYRFMAAVLAMHMALFVTATIVGGGARSRVRGGYPDHMLLDRRAVHVMKMATVQIVHMAFVNDAGVTTVGPVDVGMVFMGVCHDGFLVWMRCLIFKYSRHFCNNDCEDSSIR